MPEFRDEIAGEPIFLSLVDDEPAGELVEHGERDVLGDRLRPDQALQAAILGNIGDAEIARALADCRS